MIASPADCHWARLLPYSLTCKGRGYQDKDKKMKQSRRRQNWTKETKQTNKEKRGKHEVLPTRQTTRTWASTDSGEIQFTPQRGIYTVKNCYCLPYSITIWKIRGQTVTQGTEECFNWWFYEKRSELKFLRTQCILHHSSVSSDSQILKRKQHWPFSPIFFISVTSHFFNNRHNMQLCYSAWL